MDNLAQPAASRFPLASGDATTQVPVDIFDRDWKLAKAFWTRVHRRWDYGYLNYKSILTYNNVLGKDYMDAFGMQVFVPRTYQTVEAIKSQINSRKTEFVVKAGSGPKGFRDRERAQYFETMDNIEWRRSKGEHQKQLATHNALVFGNGYLLNLFVDDVRSQHFPIIADSTEKRPDSALTSEEDTPAIDTNTPSDMEWEEKDVTKYRGMKAVSENPYYIFTDPYAKDDQWEYAYRYNIGTVDRIRQYVVARGWLTPAEAVTKVTPCQVERFDAIKDTVDSFFDQPVTKYTRGDSAQQTSRTTDVSSDVHRGGEFNALIERYEDDYYEVRLASDPNTTLFKDWNVYPHKEIPIIVLKDNPQPDEACGIGEPELIRWQQVEENKLHNLLMQAVMLAVVQRYAINSNILEDETDIQSYNPFKPIRLKSLPGVSVAQAVMPLPQPEVKQSPFQLLEQVKQISQATSGASDFIVSANTSIADTATESQNLLAATTMRIKEKARFIEEVSLVKLVEQWHPCFYFFYDAEMDFELTGEDSFIRWIPFDRKAADENLDMIAKAKEEMNSEGETLTEVYQNAGYKQVVFLSDMEGGSFFAEAKVTDMDLDRQKTFDDGLKMMKVMNETNISAKEIGDPRRFDIFKMATDVLANMTTVRDPKTYIMNDDKTGMAQTLVPPADPNQPQLDPNAPGPTRPVGRPGNDSLMGLRPGQTTAAPTSGDVGAATRATGDVGPAQGTNLGM